MPPSPDLCCWKCGASLAALTLPLRRLEECKACGAELHVCRLCEFYDTAVAKSCREPIAEEVKDKTRANFCDYFRPRPGAYVPASDEATRAKAGLEALFAGGAESGLPPKTESSAEDEARAQLEALFGRGNG